jgi:FkbM family methyltransferase
MRDAWAWIAHRRNAAPFLQERALVMHPLVQSASFPSVGKLFYVNKIETRAIIEEIWKHRVFDGDEGLELPPDAVVIDAGAHVGLFSLYIQRLRAERKPIIYAFEPMPALFAALQANVNVHAAASQIRLFNFGLSDGERQARFYFYRNVPCLSSVEDRDAELQAMVERQGVMTLLRAHQPAVYLICRLLPFLEPLITKKIMESTVEKEAVTCRLKTLSQIIAEQKLDRIDLLKIDVEKSELPILNGITESDFAKIRRIVIEVHAPEERGAITSLLEARGFRVRTRPALDQYQIVYASKPM